MLGAEHAAKQLMRTDKLVKIKQKPVHYTYISPSRILHVKKKTGYFFYF
jgi:putative NADH-flavin reductase